MSDTTTVATLPPCDFCTSQGARPIKPARYDFKTILNGGSWANGCHNHYYQHRAFKKLGTGMGQKLMLIEGVKEAP